MGPTSGRWAWLVQELVVVRVWPGHLVMKKKNVIVLVRLKSCFRHCVHCSLEAEEIQQNPVWQYYKNYNYELINGETQKERTVDPLRDLEKTVRRFPVEEPPEQRHLMALSLLLLPRSDPNRRFHKAMYQRPDRLIYRSCSKIEQPNLKSFNKMHNVCIFSLSHTRRDFRAGNCIVQ